MKKKYLLGPYVNIMYELILDQMLHFRLHILQALRISSDNQGVTLDSSTPLI